MSTQSRSETTENFETETDNGAEETAAAILSKNSKKYTKLNESTDSELNT